MDACGLGPLSPPLHQTLASFKYPMKHTHRLHSFLFIQESNSSHSLPLKTDGIPHLSLHAHLVTSMQTQRLNLSSLSLKTDGLLPKTSPRECSSPYAHPTPVTPPYVHATVPCALSNRPTHLNNTPHALFLLHWNGESPKAFSILLSISYPTFLQP